VPDLNPIRSHVKISDGAHLFLSSYHLHVHHVKY